MQEFDLYNDIATRTGGDIYIGVVGPVRTGKSTFISKFMETMVLPNIDNKHIQSRTVDELPQSADGKTIMTTEPKFVPAEAVSIAFEEGIKCKVRMIDCVGYMVDGAMGHTENDKPRYVRTPWSDKEMPFEKAAELGTQKVIDEHSTIGVVVTTDGTITDLERGAYVPAEERVIKELKQIGKPFAVILNSATPTDAKTLTLKSAMEEKYQVPVIVMNVSMLSKDDAENILKTILLEFPVKLIEASLPKWMQALDIDNSIIRTIIDEMSAKSNGITKMSDYMALNGIFDGSDIINPDIKMEMDMGKGRIVLTLDASGDLFYKILTEECGESIDDDFKLLSYIRNLKYALKQYNMLKDALDQVETQGYGIVTPSTGEMTLEEPQIVKQGGRFGVKLKASAPSLHIMKVDVETEVNPIVGSEQQSEELVNYMLSEFENNKSGIWETDLFGKSLSSLVKEGLNNKLHSVPSEVLGKMRKTMGRIVNEGKGGVLCILL